MNYDTYKSKKYFPVLDSMRAISILLVISTHMSDNLSSDGVWSFLSGYTGVTVFFVLSGFLITMLSLREEEKDGSISIAAFYVRRFFRIVPLYFFALALVCLVVFNFGPTDMRNRLIAAIPYYLTWFNEFSPPAAFGQSWSLGIEEKFYIIWPFLGFVVLRRFPSQRLFVSVSILIFFESLHLSGLAPLMEHYRSIMVGCVMAICLHHKEIFRLIKSSGSGTPIFSYISLLFFIIMQFAYKPYEQIISIIYPYGVGVVLTGFVLSNDDKIKWLKFRPLTLIGERSYGIYLIHFLCIYAAEKLFMTGTGNLLISFMSMITAILISVFFAEILFHIIEKPMIKIGRNFSANISKYKKNYNVVSEIV